MRWIYFISVFLHILSAVTWIGGMLFLSLIIVPVSRMELFRPISARFLHFSGVRFRTIGWICLITLVLTGLLNLHFRGIHWADAVNAAFWHSYFGRTLMLKIFMVVIILVISALHDFWIGPRATEMMQQENPPAKLQKFRRAASWIGRINLILALSVVFLAIQLVRGKP